MKNVFTSCWSRILSYRMIFVVMLFFSATGNADETLSDSFNWAFQNSFGEGLSFGTQENANIYKLPLSYTFANFTDIDWSAKLKFPLTIGVYNLEVEDQDIDFDVLAVVPGIELQISLRKNWILMPLIDFGIGKDTSGGNLRYIYAIGIKHHVLFDWKQFDFTFGNTLRDDGYFTDGSDVSDDSLLFSTSIDMRFPIGIKLLHNPGYLSFYGANYYYLDEAIVIEIDSKKIEVDTQWELGITLSTVPAWKIFWFTMERVGLGYRFGDGFSAIRLVFGMPF